MLFIGITVMVLGTYANLYALETASNTVKIKVKNDLLPEKLDFNLPVTGK